MREPSGGLRESECAHEPPYLAPTAIARLRDVSPLPQLLEQVSQLAHCPITQLIRQACWLQFWTCAAGYSAHSFAPTPHPSSQPELSAHGNCLTGERVRV